jgi:hypothetical protein
VYVTSAGSLALLVFYVQSAHSKGRQIKRLHELKRHLPPFNLGGPDALMPHKMVVEMLYREAAVEPAMEVQEVIKRGTSKQIT